MCIGIKSLFDELQQKTLKLSVMATKKIIVTRTSTITMNTETKRLDLYITNRYVDGTEDSFIQDFNLEVVPYDMAMSVICSLINPTRK